jgi:hypothetical protein
MPAHTSSRSVRSVGRGQLRKGKNRFAKTMPRWFHRTALGSSLVVTLSRLS